MVMKQLGYKQTGTTIIHIDNMSALKMINENTASTEQCCHVKLRYWILQDWVCIDKVMLVKHLPGVLSISDNQTKLLGYVLYARHCRHAMDHYT